MGFMKRLFCRHRFKPMAGLMGFFCKVQCEKCGKIDNDWTDSVTTVITLPTIYIKSDKESGMRLNPEITDPFIRKLRNLEPPEKGSREDYIEHHENPNYDYERTENEENTDCKD